MSLCSRCGAQFGCAMAAQDRADPAPADDKNDACWCTLLPAIARVPDATDATGACWCRACLQRHIDEHQLALTAAELGPGPAAIR